MTDLTKQTPQPSAIRDMLFGDAPIAEWPSNSSTASHDEPWLSFIQANEQLKAGDQEAAQQTLVRILSMPDLESRHYLQAWTFLRAIGKHPDADEAKRIYGVVVEVAMPDGLDIVAAYADHTARYFNYSGAAVVWETPDDSLDEIIDSLLEAGRIVAEQIGPWEGERPPAPLQGQVRISLLVPSGLHFGEGPFEALARDHLGGPVVSAATQLMLALIAKTEQAKSLPDDGPSA
jgi:hypothetical protein